MGALHDVMYYLVWVGGWICRVCVCLRECVWGGGHCNNMYLVQNYYSTVLILNKSLDILSIV